MLGEPGEGVFVRRNQRVPSARPVLPSRAKNPDLARSGSRKLTHEATVPFTYQGNLFIIHALRHKHVRRCAGP
jgi:hypothetical protein